MSVPEIEVHASVQSVGTQPLPGPLVRLLAAGAGLGAASLYYSQPLLAELGHEFPAGARWTGFVPTLTQLGYALGVLLLAPLGDRHDRRQIILVKSVVLVVGLVACAVAPTMGWMLASSLLVGVAATLAQDIVPTAAALAPDVQRGRTVGTVMTGLLLGILLSRVVSGLIAAYWSWRIVYLGSAGVIIGLAVLLRRQLPQMAPTTTLSYGALLRSLGTLWGRHGGLRRAVVAQGLLAFAFSAFWSTLALMLQDRYGLGSAVAGALGLAGAAGALAAPLAGRIADRHGSLPVTRYGTLFSVVAFASLALDAWLPTVLRMGALVLATVVFDFGVQASLIGHQTVVYGLEPQARSRLNAVFLTGLFLGMSLGSATGNLLFTYGGWLAVVALMTAAAVSALIVVTVPAISARWFASDGATVKQSASKGGAEA